MFIIRKLLLYITSGFIIFSLELLRSFNSFWWLFLIINILLIVITLWEFSKRKMNLRLVNFSLAPVLFVLSVYFFVMFLENVYIYRLVYLSAGFFVYLYLEQTLNYFYFTSKYQPYTLENLSLYLIVLNVFFTTTAIFSSLIFLRLSMLVSALLILLIIFVLTHQVFWSNKIKWNDYRIFCFINSFLMAQLFLVLSFLPLSFYVNALIMSVFFYIITNISRLFLLKSLDKKNIWEHSFVGASIIMITLLTAQWF
jgi:hypothetical protein